MFSRLPLYQGSNRPLVGVKAFCLEAFRWAFAISFISGFFFWSAILVLLFLHGSVISMYILMGLLRKQSGVLDYKPSEFLVLWILVVVMSIPTTMAMGALWGLFWLAVFFGYSYLHSLI